MGKFRKNFFTLKVSFAGILEAEGEAMANSYETGRVLNELRCQSCGHEWFQRKYGEVYDLRHF